MSAVHPLLTAVADLHDELRERGNAIDAERQLPEDIARRLAALGLYRLVTPAGLGGMDASPRLFCEICEQLAGANGSAAWCVFIGTTSQLSLVSLEPEMTAQITADPSAIMSGVFADSGSACFEPRNGEPGYRINGHWRWGSSCHNAAWISGGLHEVDASGEPVASDNPIARAVFKPEELDIQDNWHTSGLRGTGSSDYMARDVWLPAVRLGRTKPQREFTGAPVYRFPQFGLLAIPIGAIALGLARACIDEVLTLAQSKTPQGSRRTLAQRPMLHQEIALIDTEVRAARALFYEEIDSAWAGAQEGRPGIDARRGIRTATVHALRASVRAVDRMYSVVGGSSVYNDSVLQQHFRDIHVASQHMMVGEPVLELAGRVMLGIDDKAPGL